MSNAPYVLPRARKGCALGDSTLVDALIHDGLWSRSSMPHGCVGRICGGTFRRLAGGAGPLRGGDHQKAARAASRSFKSEIVPLDVPTAQGAAVLMDQDEPYGPTPRLKF